MTTESLRLALECWLSTLPPQIKVLIEPHSAPPAMLDLRVLLPELPADSSGFALELTLDDEQFSAWVPVSGRGGSYFACTEGDDELCNYLLPSFEDERGPSPRSAHASKTTFWPRLIRQSLSRPACRRHRARPRLLNHTAPLEASKNFPPGTPHT